MNIPNLPQKDKVQLCLKMLWSTLFPKHHMTASKIDLKKELATQIRKAFACQGSTITLKQAQLLVRDFLSKLPHIRQKLEADAQGACNRDPAALNIHEVIMAYPGFLALMTYRLAHELAQLKVPMLPRMMSSMAQSETGCDIHPDAKIGDSLFIDHATGVVIGQTSVIGNRVTIFQGVTLGALALQEKGSSKQRHPTIEDDVILYSNATILGGKTVIGKGSIIGGSCWITYSVPPHSKVILANPRAMVTHSQKNVDEIPNWDI